jgi:hypothetical protein
VAPEIVGSTSKLIEEARLVNLEAVLGKAVALIFVRLDAEDSFLRFLKIYPVFFFRR